MSLLFGVSDATRVTARLAGFYGPAPSDPEVAQSYLGTPVFDQLIFPKDANPEIELSEDLILNDVLFRVTRQKSIIRTPVQGRPGEVNEIISHGDYNVEIAGKVVSEEMLVKPKEAIRALIQIDDFLGSVGIAVNFLSLFDIDTIIIDRTEWPQEQGRYNEQPFAIFARSENPIELQIQGNNASAT